MPNPHSEFGSYGELILRRPWIFVGQLLVVGLIAYLAVVTATGG